MDQITNPVYTPQHYYPKPFTQIPDKPLIEMVTNEWRNNRAFKDHYEKDLEEDEYGQFIMSDKDASGSMFRCPRMPRRNCKYILAYAIVIISALYFWMEYLKPSMEEEDLLDTSLYQSNPRPFGSNVRPEFTGMIQVQYLDSHYLPGATHASRKRLVVVGDVHGCKEERKAYLGLGGYAKSRLKKKANHFPVLHLLEKLEFDKETDHLVLAGDMIFKGPDSAAVIAYAREIGASCVRGNHEDSTLLAYAAMHSGLLKLTEPKPEGGAKNFGPDQILNHGDARHKKLAMELKEHDIKWLQKCPVILNVGTIVKTDYAIVHAGLSAGVPLEKQDPFMVMNMRTIDLRTRVPSDLRKGAPWEKVFDTTPYINLRSNLANTSKGLESLPSPCPGCSPQDCHIWSRRQARLESPEVLQRH
jgi:hypothetical protein